MLYYASPPYIQRTKKPQHLLRGRGAFAGLVDALAGVSMSSTSEPAEDNFDVSYAPVWAYSDRIPINFTLFDCTRSTQASVSMTACALRSTPYHVARDLSFEDNAMAAWVERNLPKFLTVKGAIVGELTDVESSALEDLPRLFKYIFAGYYYPVITNEFASLGPQLSYAEALDVVSRTILCDVYRKEGFEIPKHQIISDLDRYLRLRDPKRGFFWQKIDPGWKWKIGEWLFKRAHVKITRSMAALKVFQTGREIGLLQTADGLRIGSFPEEAKVGDTIVVLWGASTPLCLRENLDTWRRASPRGNSWRLLGECYVDGIMDGELVERDEATGEYTVQGSVVEDFDLA